MTLSLFLIPSPIQSFKDKRALLYRQLTGKLKSAIIIYNNKKAAISWLLLLQMISYSTLF